MKFGDNLQQKSVPQWAPYNVDYNGIKELIKTQTSNHTSGPIQIPVEGQTSDQWHKLESELLLVLRAQHEKATQFTRMKYGEIGRRLTHLERTRSAVLRRAADSASGKPIQQNRRYQSLIREAEDVGDDIQALSRFTNTQRIAFQKILKKYEKWTSSTSLRRTVHKKLLDNGSLRPNLALYLQRLSDITNIVAKLPNPSTASPASGLTASAAAKSSPFRLHEATVSKSGLQLDAALAAVPLGKAAGRAMYWVHQDNVEEARVLLLRHMSGLNVEQSRLEETSTIGMPSQDLNESETSLTDHNVDRIHDIFYDNLLRFTQQQSAFTISQMEDMEGAVPSKVALSTRWIEGSDAATVLMSDLSPTCQGQSQWVNCRKRDLPGLLTPDNRLTRASTKDPHRSPLVQDFVARHPDIIALARMASSRTRYAGINNTAETGIWATLDKDIDMALPEQADHGYDVDDKHFPHAVLQLRWEHAPNIPEVVRYFDSSHVAERVRGFTLEAHAIFAIGKPDMPQPLWYDLLEKDIRKVPVILSRSARRKAAQVRGSVDGFAGPNKSGPSSTEGPSTSDGIFSTNQGPSSVTSAYTPNTSTADLISPVECIVKPSSEEPPKRRKRQNPRQLNIHTPVRRYWNEFDDGSEAEEEEYAIYVNPDEPMHLPGADTVFKAISAMYDSLARGKRKVVSWLPMKATEAERRPLLRSQVSTDNDNVDSSDSESEMGKAQAATVVDLPHHRTTNRASRRTTSFSRQTNRPLTPRQQAREMVLFRTYTGLFMLSGVILVVSVILKITGRRKAMLEVDAGVITGTIASEACGAFAVGLVSKRKRGSVGLIQYLIIGLAEAIIVVAGVALLIYVVVGGG